jgi:hypothetical protein
MAKDVLQKYGATTVITASLASLASDTNLLAGLESAVIDNTTDGFEDIIISGKVTTGTSPTAARQIEVWAVAWDSNGWPDVFDEITRKSNEKLKPLARCCRILVCFGRPYRISFA